MKRITLLLVCLLFVASCHKDKKEETNSIYEPYVDSPKPLPHSEKKMIAANDEDVEDSYVIPEERRKQYQQFNEMLAYGLIFGTLLLACMLLKTCTNHGTRGPVTRPSTQMNNYVTRTPMLNKTPSSLEIRNKIQMLKKEVKRLEHHAKQAEDAEQRAFAERQRQMKRQQEVMKVYYNQMEMQQTIQPKVYYNQPIQAYSHPYEHMENIPVGRPIPRDNDSSFASEYPTI